MSNLVCWERLANDHKLKCWKNDKTFIFSVPNLKILGSRFLMKFWQNKSVLWKRLENCHQVFKSLFQKSFNENFSIKLYWKLICFYCFNFIWLSYFHNFCFYFFYSQFINCKTIKVYGYGFISFFPYLLFILLLTFNLMLFSWLTPSILMKGKISYSFSRKRKSRTVNILIKKHLSIAIFAPTLEQ